MTELAYAQGNVPDLDMPLLPVAGKAKPLANVLEARRKALETVELEARVSALEGKRR